MLALAVWWIGIEAVGAAAFPLTFLFFHRLPDRGYAFSKVIGLLLLSYALWIGAFLGLFPNSRGAVILLLVLLAACSLLAVSRRRDEIVAYVRSGWRYLLFVEVMFALVLAAAVFLRSFAPSIDSGEKPFELAFLNSINRTQSFPPPDPWLSGHSISYYYFGYVMVSALTKLVALDTNVTFFLGLSLVAALTWVSAFGLVYNLVLSSRRETVDAGPPLVPRAVLFGLVAAVLMLVVSNFEGVFELMARHDAAPGWLYSRLHIFGLPGPYDCANAPGDCAQWYPTRNYWWWWATRIGSNYDIQEFPFFSLHFGDLHAHVMAMPFLLVLFAAVFQIIATVRGAGERLGLGWLLRHPWRALLLALLAGGILFIDSWAAPLTVLMLVAVALVAGWLQDGRPLRALPAVAGFAVPVLAGMLLLYLPYYWHLQGDVHGIAVDRTAVPSIVPQASRATRPAHFILFWGPLLWVVLPFVLAYVARHRRDALRFPVAALAIVPWAVPLALWGVLIAAGHGTGAFADELRQRGWNLLTIAALAAAISVAAAAFLHALLRRQDERDPGGLFAFLLGGFALMMLLGAELFYVNDSLGFRANTVFRFWHESWLLLSVAGAFGLYRLTSRWRLPRLQLGAVPWRYAAGWGAALGAAYTIFVAVDPTHTLYSRWWTATPGLFIAGLSVLAFAAVSAWQDGPRPAAYRQLAWLAATALVLAAALVYPALVTFDRTGGFANAQTMNGLDFLQAADPREYEAVQWLKQNVTGTPVILEATGPDFGQAARISSRTGLPTVIGWTGHEEQWRGTPGPSDAGQPAFSVRPADVMRAYTTADAGVAQAILQKYDVKYVYVGSLERTTYGLAGLDKFKQFMDVAFQNAEVTIYISRGEPVAFKP